MFLYAPESVYAMDREAVETDGLSEIELMGRAGSRVWQTLIERWPNVSKISVFAGAGNNGGDAFVVAMLARKQSVQVQLICHGDLNQQSATSAHYRELYQQAGGEIEDWSQQTIVGEVIVDGLLGIGLSRGLDDKWQGLIRQINQHSAPVVAIDIPSGLNASTGTPSPCAIEADVTVTFIGRKIGHYLADGFDYCGDMVFDELGISSTTRCSQQPTLQVIDRDNLQLPNKRKFNSHKNNFGHVLVIGGDRGMSGAAMLAGQAALRCGAGMVTVLVHADNQQSLTAIPELMVQSWAAIKEKIAQASVIVVGPGLGQSKMAMECLDLLKDATQPMVIDADALNAEFIDRLASKQIVITPHPGEAARLLSTSGHDIQADRISSSQQLTERFNVVSVLKGCGSIIREPKSALAAINIHGHAGMASAGMGDVLAGLIGALIGQGLSTFEATRSAVFLHALCAETYAREYDGASLIASDISQILPTVVKQLRDSRC